jgi:hypothetical protein
MFAGEDTLNGILLKRLIEEPDEEVCQLVNRDHKWRLEFERIVNRKSFLSLTEYFVRTLEEHFASIALAKKILTKTIDRAFEIAQKSSFSSKPKRTIVPAEWQEYDLYITEYLGYADAMIAVARRHH